MEVGHLTLNRKTWISLVAVGLGGAILCAILYFALLSPDPLPDRWWLRGNNDTALHVLAFGALTVPLALLFGPWSGFLIAVLAALSVELMQVTLPRRTATVDDFLAGVAGAVAVSAVVALIRRVRR